MDFSDLNPGCQEYVDSRVTLDTERDRLGMRKVMIDWRFGDMERKTLQRMNTMIAQAVGGAGLGRVREIPDDGDSGWPPGIRGAISGAGRFTGARGRSNF